MAMTLPDPPRGDHSEDRVREPGNLSRLDSPVATSRKSGQSCRESCGCGARSRVLGLALVLYGFAEALELFDARVYE
jgi:hypothetical protein